MISVVIAAHNEGRVLGRCLGSLLQEAVPGELDITVVPNGCTDDTALVAAAHGARVISLAQAGKAPALNAGDAAARGFPRLYVDADIPLTTAAVRALAGALESESGKLAAVPRRQLDLRGRPWAVRSYFAVSSRLPAFENGLFGRGVIAVSERGRARFERFPELVADDLFLDSLFADDEKAHVTEVCTVVATPRRTRDLLRRLVRVRRGNTALRRARLSAGVPVNVRPADRLSWLRDVVVDRPRLVPAGLVYATVTILAAAVARFTPERDDWGRDESTRAPEFSR